MDSKSLLGICECEKGKESRGRALFFVKISGKFPESGIALPLENYRVRATALKELRAYKGKTLRNRVKIDLLRFFNFKFIWKLLYGKSFCIYEHADNLLSFISRQQSIINGHTLKNGITSSIYVGSRKFLLPLIDRGSGEVIAYAKAYFPGIESEYGKNEAMVLKKLEKVDLKYVEVPKVLFEGDLKDFFLLVLSPGKQLENFHTLSTSHTQFLRNLSEKTGSEFIFEKSPFLKQFDAEVSFIESTVPAHAELVRNFYENAKKNLNGKKFLFALTKREFPFFEMLRKNDSAKPFFVVDWEQARYDFPTIFDAMSLLLSTAKGEAGDYSKQYESNLKKLFFSPNLMSANVIREVSTFCKMSREDAYWFFWLFLLDQLYIHLHVGHTSSADRVIAFLAGADGMEGNLLERWLPSYKR